MYLSVGNKDPTPNLAKQDHYQQIPESSKHQILILRLKPYPSGSEEIGEGEQGGAEGGAKMCRLYARNFRKYK